MFTTDPTTDIGFVRLLITDRDPRNPLFPDDTDIQAFIDAETTIKSAAALALETVATDQVLVLKVIKNLQLSTDGAKVSDALLKRAALLRAQSVASGDDTDATFDYAEWAVNDFAAREIRTNVARRRLA